MIPRTIPNWVKTPLKIHSWWDRLRRRHPYAHQHSRWFWTELFPRGRRVQHITQYQSPPRQKIYMTWAMWVWDLRDAYRPRLNNVTELLKPMRAAPPAVNKALTLVAPLRPRESMTRFASRLPMRPPTVKMAVTTEKINSDMGMHVDRPKWIRSEDLSLQVSTACIWLRTEIW